jgi:steroid delta-isomerase-like uncharacterized protein
MSEQAGADEVQIRAIIHDIYARIFSKGDFDYADEVFAADFTEHFPDTIPGQPTHGPQAVKWYVRELREAFPDIEVTVQSVIVEGDQAAARVTFTGTHNGFLLYVPATGRPVDVEGIDMARFAGGKIAEHWGGWNMLHLLNELDALPVPEGTM